MGRGDAAASARWEFTSTGRNHVRSVSGFIPQPASDASDRHTLRAQPGRRATTDLGSQILNGGSPMRAPTEVDVTLREPEVDAASRSSWSIPVP